MNSPGTAFKEPFLGGLHYPTVGSSGHLETFELWGNALYLDFEWQAVQFSFVEEENYLKRRIYKKNFSFSFFQLTSAQRLLLALQSWKDLRGYVWCQGSNQSQLYAEQVPCPLF